ncbi:hypothetical protein CUR86_17650 [Salinicola acroporae]|uniref:Lipoprotein n=2 Tax=Salinicola acroporae TaxID=1541440 RepID=A0ABT6I8S3_9GAMM|nr:hypothetical protein [Salinicola acroporae]
MCALPAFLLSALALAGCASLMDRSSLSPAQNARVAVYETLVENNASGQQGNAAAYCIGYGRASRLSDPDDAVLAALSSNARVRPASDCNVSDRGAQAVLRSTGERALMFGTSDVRCESDTECTLSGGYYEANASGQTNVYRARRVDGEWQVELKELGPIA